jgi:hypothetical protein
MKPELELLFTLHVTGQPNDLGPTPHGQRRFVQITGGSFEGPQLSGEVLPVGIDNALIRRDGVFEPNVNLVLRTTDQSLIHVMYHGRFFAPEQVMARLLRRDDGVDPQSYYLRTAVFFETSAPALLWLNHTLAIGCGETRPITDKGIGIAYTVYRVH